MRSCSASLFAGVIALGCTDTAPTASPAHPAGTLRVVLADTARPAPGQRSGAAARPSLALADGNVEISVTSLGILEPCQHPFGFCPSQAYDINDAGHVVGITPGAFLWTPAAGWIESDAAFLARGINARGQVVGTEGLEGRESRPLLWEPGRGVRALPTPSGYPSGDAVDINDAGRAVGSVRPAGGFSYLTVRAAVWEPDGTVTRLGTLPGYHGSAAAAVNAAGQVVGHAILAEDYGTLSGTRAFIWERGAGMRALGPFESGRLSYSAALGINAAGQVVGYADGRGFLWDPATGLRDLGGFVPVDINDHGDMIGTGAVWLAGREPVPLPNPPGLFGSSAEAINNARQIVGSTMAPPPIPDEHSFIDRATLWTVHVAGAGAPTVDRVHAVVLPPGVVPGLSGVWLRVRLTDEGDAGPWDWRIDWGDGTPPSTPQDVKYSGEFAFLRSKPYTAAGSHTITVTATDPGGLTSAAATTTVP
jgi:probable HAF family extracellular repeat protein